MVVVQNTASPCNIFSEPTVTYSRVAEETLAIRQFGAKELFSKQPIFCERYEIHTWVFSYAELFTVPSLQDSLSAFEMERAALFSTKELSRRFVFARGLLRTVLSRYVGEKPKDILFQYTSLGKPYVNNRTLHFNLSHSGDLVFLVVSEEFELGADVEELRPVAEALSISNRWFSTPEVKWISASADHDAAFLRCWVIREAFVKAVGFGLMLPLNSFGVFLPEFDDERKEEAAMYLAPVITKHERGEDVHIIEYQPKHGYCAAIAVLTV